jgi:6-pyruvoyltetrahydropterin/6-carboxytetrahydropterin synthase
MDIDFAQFDFMPKLITLPFQPTCENLLIHYADLIKPQLPSSLTLHSLFLRETPTSYAEWFANDN